MKQAFELRAEFAKPPVEGGFAGGSVTTPDSTTHNLQDLFDSKDHGPKGKIVTDDPALAAELDVHAALKSTTVPGGADPAPKVDEKVAGLSGAANAGDPVDEYGQPVDQPAAPAASESADTESEG